jgi:hypothetical protein
MRLHWRSGLLLALCAAFAVGVAPAAAVEGDQPPRPPRWQMPRFGDQSARAEAEVSLDRVRRLIGEKKWDEARAEIDRLKKRAEEENDRYRDAEASYFEAQREARRAKGAAKAQLDRTVRSHLELGTRAFANKNGFENLAARLDEELFHAMEADRLRPPPPDPGRGPVWQPPPWWRFYRYIGLGPTGGAMNIPAIGAGTRLVGNREVPILFSARNLAFVGAEARVGLPVNFLIDSVVVMRGGGASLYGQTNGVVRAGTNSVAFTNLFANPATGNTGVLAGATGLGASIRTRGEFFYFDVVLQREYRPLAMPQISFPWGIGAAYDYSDIGHVIDQQSLTFADLSSRTKLVSENHFAAPVLSGGVRIDDGNVSAELIGYVKPGFNIFRGRADQDNRCGPCPNPGDRSFSLRRSFSDTRFAVKTGAELNFDVRLTQSLRLTLGGFYEFTSTTGFVRIPTTPAEQPVRADRGATHRYGGRVNVVFRF